MYILGENYKLFYLFNIYFYVSNNIQGEDETLTPSCTHNDEFHHAMSNN